MTDVLAVLETPTLLVDLIVLRPLGRDGRHARLKGGALIAAWGEIRLRTANVRLVATLKKRSF
jgi:hypothetical protein